MLQMGKSTDLKLGMAGEAVKQVGALNGGYLLKWQSWGEIATPTGPGNWKEWKMVNQASVPKWRNTYKNGTSSQNYLVLLAIRRFCMDVGEL